MISKEVEDRITYWYFYNHLPRHIKEELESILLPYFLEDEEPSADEMVWLAIEFIQSKLDELEE